GSLLVQTWAWREPKRDSSAKTRPRNDKRVGSGQNAFVNRGRPLMRRYYVYILASASGVLYTGVTNSLQRRVIQHRLKQVPGFTKKYNVTRLVYFEVFGNIRLAIAREKE